MNVYIVLCRDNSYYTGVTNDLDRRLAEHNMGLDPSCYTYSRRPVRLVYMEAYDDPNEAIRREKQIRGWSRKKKQAIITMNRRKLVELSRGRKKNKNSEVIFRPGSG